MTETQENRGFAANDSPAQFLNSAHSCRISAKRLIENRESPSLRAMKPFPPSQLARVNVLLSADEAERFNAYCSRQGFKKSTLIARLVREHLDREDEEGSKKRRPKAASKERAA